MPLQPHHLIKPSRAWIFAAFLAIAELGLPAYFAGASEPETTAAKSTADDETLTNRNSHDPLPRKSLAAGSGDLINQLNSRVGMVSIPATRSEQGRTKHFKESCSGTLVSTNEERSSTIWVLSAWHCFEDYRDLSRDILFTTVNGQSAKARLVSSGGSMRADWALLKLDTPMEPAVKLLAREFDVNASIIMAGYPRANRQQAGEHSQVGRTFTVANRCAVTGQDKEDFASTCVLPKGSSGGAVFALANAHADPPTHSLPRAGQSNTPATKADEEQARPSDELQTGIEPFRASIELTQGNVELPRFVGVISRGDSESLSIFVPLQRILPAIANHLR